MWSCRLLCKQIAANELSSSKTSTLPVRDRLNTPTQTRTDATADSGSFTFFFFFGSIIIIIKNNWIWIWILNFDFLGDGRNVRGPRCITIQRSSAGFGFTLRHFIVYPPDSVSVSFLPYFNCKGIFFIWERKNDFVFFQSLSSFSRKEWGKTARLQLHGMKWCSFSMCVWVRVFLNRRLATPAKEEEEEERGMLMLLHSLSM